MARWTAIQYKIIDPMRSKLQGWQSTKLKDGYYKASRAAQIVGQIGRNLVIERQETYCPRLWDSAYVDQNGNVFACCYGQPAAFGNIHQETMQSIWQNSRRLKLLRWMARNRSLHCTYNCNLITPAEKKTPAIPQQPLPYPETIRLLLGERCNVACTMCWQNHKDPHIIDTNLVKSAIDWEKVKDIELQGGEVLLMREGRELFLWLNQEMRKKVDLITNGTLLSDTWAEHLVRGSQWVQVSVNAATQAVHERVNIHSRFERVIANIQKMVRLKRELGTDVEIIYKYTIIPDNIHEIDAAIAYANQIGCNKIAFGYDLSVPGYLDNHPELRSSLRQQLKSRLAMQLPIEIERIRLEYLGLLDTQQVSSR